MSPRGSKLAVETCHATRENPPGRLSYVAESLEHASWIRRCALKRRSETKKNRVQSYMPSHQRAAQEDISSTRRRRSAKSKVSRQQNSLNAGARVER